MKNLFDTLNNKSNFYKLQKINYKGIKNGNAIHRHSSRQEMKNNPVMSRFTNILNTAVNSQYYDTFGSFFTQVYPMIGKTMENYKNSSKFYKDGQDKGYSKAIWSRINLENMLGVGAFFWIWYMTTKNENKSAKEFETKCEEIKQKFALEDGIIPDILYGSDKKLRHRDDIYNDITNKEIIIPKEEINELVDLAKKHSKLKKKSEEYRYDHKIKNHIEKMSPELHRMVLSDIGEAFNFIPDTNINHEAKNEMIKAGINESKGKDKIKGMEHQIATKFHEAIRPHK